MKQVVKVSAPGKLILMGEHAVVYGKPALIASVDKRCFVSISERKDKKVKVVSQNFKKDIVTDLPSVLKKFYSAENDWKNFDKNNDVELLKSITTEVLDYPQIIIGQFFDYFKLKSINGLDVIIHSEISIGAGMGSSAALAVAIIGALFLFFKIKFDKKIINEIAFLAEQKKHGRPSGGDNSASCFGGLIQFQKGRVIKIPDINLSKNIAKNFYVKNTGTPDESTGEMISIVKSLYQKKPKFVEDVFADQEKLAAKFLDVLNEEDENEILQAISKGEKNLEKIGVVSAGAQKIIREIEKSGGAAKICGGGGKTKAAGIILVYHKNLQTLRKLLKSNHRFTQIILGCEGLRKEL